MQANHLDARIDLCGCADQVLKSEEVLTSRPAAPPAADGRLDG